MKLAPTECVDKPVCWVGQPVNWSVSLLVSVTSMSGWSVGQSFSRLIIRLAG